MNERNRSQGQSGNKHIIVNGRQHSIDGDSLTYEELVALAFPGGGTANVLYSVMYSGPNMADGSLGQGASIEIKNGMKFDVSQTNRS